MFQETKRFLTNSIITLTLSFFGCLIFWSFGGCLTSFSTVHQPSLPLDSLNDLNSNNGFLLLIQNNSAHHSALKKWAWKSTKNKQTFEKQVKVFNMTNIMKIFNDIMENGDSGWLASGTFIKGYLNSRKY